MPSVDKDEGEGGESFLTTPHNFPMHVVHSCDAGKAL